MANIQRLITLVFALVSFPAVSSIPHPLGGVEYRLGSFTGDKQSTCAAYVGSLTTEPHDTSVSGDYCLFLSTDGRVFQSYLFQITSTPRPPCPANSSDPGTNECVCDKGYAEDAKHASCVKSFVDDAQAIADSLNRSGDQFCTQNHQVTGLSVCFGGYSMRGSVIAETSGKNADGTAQQCIQGPFTTGGVPCDPNAPDKNVSGDGTCKGGKVPGQVNGVTICVTPGSTTSKPSPTTTTGTDASGNQTSTTVDKTTSCASDKCTTTTTTTTTTTLGGGGSGAGTTTTKTDTTTTDQPKDSFCKDNPTSPMCKTSSFFGGDCGSPPSCDGDAIQCAVASFTYSTKCALTVEPKDSADIAAYKAEAAKGQGDQTKDITTEVHIGPDNFDQTDLLGTHGGLQDQVVTVAGQQVTIPWSSLNDKLVLIGQIAQAVTFLLCLRIVFRG